MRAIAKGIFENLTPNQALTELLSEYQLDFNGYHLIAMGKPAPYFTQALIRQFHFSSILCITKRGHSIEADFEQWEADHPQISRSNLEMTKKLKQKLAAFNSEDRVLFLVSGGASAMLIDPALEFNLFQKLWDQMLFEGWPIEKMNKIRILSDKVKGGGLLKSFRAKEVINLYVSDVPEDPFDLVSSAPTNPVKLDHTQLTSLIQKVADQNLKSLLKEQLSNYQPPQREVKNYLLQSTQNLIQVAKQQLTLAFPQYLFLLDDDIRSETAQAFIARRPQLSKKSIFMSIGETGIKVDKKEGKGGRNSHLVLMMSELLAEDEEFFSLATDGNDGNSGFGGGWVRTGELAPLEVSAALDQFDSASLLAKYNLHFDFGPSSTNLMDLRVLIRH